jgi:hypothetical protein
LRRFLAGALAFEDVADDVGREHRNLRFASSSDEA